MGMKKDSFIPTWGNVMIILIQEKINSKSKAWILPLQNDAEYLLTWESVVCYELIRRNEKIIAEIYC